MGYMEVRYLLVSRGGDLTPKDGVTPNLEACMRGLEGDFKSFYPDVWAGVSATHPLWCMPKTMKIDP